MFHTIASGYKNKNFILQVTFQTQFVNLAVEKLMEYYFFSSMEKHPVVPIFTTWWRWGAIIPAELNDGHVSLTDPNTQSCNSKEDQMNSIFRCSIPFFRRFTQPGAILARLGLASPFLCSA